MPPQSVYGSFETNGDLLSDEAWDFRIQSTPSTFPVKRYASSREIAKELLRGAGRFRSPLNMIDRLQLWLQSEAVPPDFFQLSSFFLFPTMPGGIPYPWRVLLRYLKKHQLITDAVALPCLFLHDQPRMLSFTVQAAHSTLTGRGNTDTPEESLSKAIGEVLERTFCSRRYRKHERVASIAELAKQGIQFLHPGQLAQILDHGGSHTGLSADDMSTRWHWVRGNALSGGANVLLPAQAVYLGGAFPGEPLLRETNSNGSAGGFTFLEAVLSALYELIERDSFLVFWLNSIAPPILDISDISDERLRRLLRSIDRYKLEAVFLNTTTDVGIPACVCILIDRSQRQPSFSLGGGAGYDIERMLLSSLREAIMVYGGSDYLRDPALIAEDDYVPFVDSKFGLLERITFWKNPDMFGKFEFFLQGKRQSVQEAYGARAQSIGVQEQYDVVMRQLYTLGTGYEAYVYQTRSSILDRIGYHVVKVIVPAMISLNLYESNAPLRAKRLREAPLAMGYTPAEKYNPWPHPFP